MTITKPNYLSGTVGATPVVLDTFSIDAPVSITISPGSGNTSLIETSTTITAVSDPATAIWLEWPAGVVNADTRDVSFGKIVAIRFTRVTGASLDNYEVA